MLKINNTQILKMTTTVLKSLPILKPEIQRIIDNIKVMDIVNLQLDFYKKHHFFNFNAAGTLNIHQYEGQYLLVDGQHRLAALEKLYDDHGHDIEVYVQQVEVQSKEELEFNYNMLNKNTPLPDFSQFENIKKEIPETVASHFQLLYSKIWSKTSKARRPHIYFNYFQESLAYICDQAKINDIQVLQDLITNYNAKLISWDKEMIQKRFNVNDNQYNSAKEQGFFLGLISYQSSEEYGFLWAKHIVEDLTGQIIKSTSSNANKKKKIPKKVKNDAWDQYVGKNIATVPCLCCQKTEINAKDFVAGHILSEHNGGEVTVDNLVPICSPCNTSMGTTNMGEYIETYYPENKDAFLAKQYNTSSFNNTNDNSNTSGNSNKIWAYFAGNK